MPGLELGFSRAEEEEEEEEEEEPAGHEHEQHQWEKQPPQHSVRRSCGRRRRGGGGGRTREGQGSSPNSIILFPNPNISSSVSNNNKSNPFFISGAGDSLFSSAPVDRCSFGSDHDALLPQHSLHLAGRERPSRGGGGPDPDREKRRPSFDITTPHKSKESDREEEGEEEEEEEVEGEEEVTLDPAKHSFSIALRECQNRRSRSEALPSPAARKHRKRRPASLDLNAQGKDACVSYPGFFVAAGGGMKKSSVVPSRSRSGTFPSPATPNYRHGGGAVGYQKGWSSERVPLPMNSSRRYGSSSALLPFNNGRTLPSKWEDAEKWIFSPVSGEGSAGRTSALPPHHRRPKSKSGPLGAPMGASYPSTSPLVPGFDGIGGRMGNFTASSPFLTGVLVTEGGCCGSASSGRGGSGSEGGAGGRGGRSYSAHTDPSIARSASVHGWSDLLIESSSSFPSSQDEKLDNTKDAATVISPVVLKKDMATQMSPECSTQSSPKERPHFSPSPPSSSHTIEELQSHFSKLEIRDVQVDDRVTVTRWSKKHVARGTDKGSANIIEWKKKTMEARGSAWEVAETAKCISKFKREEAKITAWENLQKAKAEAAIRKLEMKLEKKRSSSMDKILNKLRSAQRKAQAMRNAVTGSQANLVAKTNRKAPSFRRAGQMGTLSGCFTCHAF